MRRIRLWQYAVSILLFGMLVTSCASTNPNGAGATLPGSTATISGTPTASPHGSTTTALPQESCAKFLPSSPCTKYAGVSGTAKSKALPWVASGGVTAQLTSINGDLQLTVTTSCGPLSGSAKLTGTTLTVGNIATGAMGCIDHLGEQQLWVLHFLERPIKQSYYRATLTWRSGTDTLSFKGS